MPGFAQDIKSGMQTFLYLLSLV